ncbi:auxin response factor 5 isoform X2 [Helianthus annuus]|uniref:auxin response factor 5 isoform X2 n=1 Tax=Helianthus annuus TaxID=4232 RepID=UPI001652BACD|nr:auxin response factor 5 isoform X2 [Helianthus annuus]
MWWWLGSVRRLGGPRCVAVKLKMECSGLWLKMARPRKFVSVHVTSPSEFVIPLAKYYKAVYSNQISLGMWFQMMFETKESGTRMYMGTIISDLNGVRWKNSQWRNLQLYS